MPSLRSEFGSPFVSRVTRQALDHPRRAIAIAVFLAVVAAIFVSSMDRALRTDRTDYDDPSSASVAARTTFAHAVGHGAEPGVLAAAPLAEAPRVEETIRADPAIAAVAIRHRPGSSNVLLIAYFKPLSAAREQEAFGRIRDAVRTSTGAKLGGVVAFNEDANRISGADIYRVELVALPLLFLVLAFALRSVRLAVTMICIGVLSMLLSMLLLRVVASWLGISVFAVNLEVALALGLVIDYSLLTVARAREELLREGDPRAALEAATLPVGRTIVASGLILVAAMATLGVFPQRFLYSMAVAGVLAVCSSCAVSVYVLPAILSLRPGWLAGRQGQAIAAAALDGRNRWFRLAQLVRRHPVPVLLACVAVLAALIVPFAGLRFTGVNETALPTSAESRQVDDLLQRQMSEARAETMFAMLPAATPARRQDRLVAGLRELPGVAAAHRLPSRTGGVAISVQTRFDSLTPRAQRLTGEARALLAPEKGLLGGPTPSFVDQRESIESRLPLVLALLFGGALVLVGLVLRSLVLPLKTFLLNLLTLGATLGFLVLVFQDGNFESLLGYRGQGAVDLTQPILLSVVAFGLMTDYSIFLLTRIRECYVDGATNGDAVVSGLGHTGRVISWAAVGVCTAIGALVFSEIIFIKQLGLGTAFAVALDATVVRCLLLPASMVLLGSWNWWLPRRWANVPGLAGSREGSR